MSAIDTLSKLAAGDTGKLDPLQRVLVITDGTLSEILEATFCERIELIKVSQTTAPAAEAHRELGLEEGDTVMERQILLQGTDSGKNYVYAESSIATERLGRALCSDLNDSQTPLGRLWLQHRLETFKEMLEVKCRPAGELHHHFGCGESSPLLMRRYRVFSGGQGVMLITEYFPVQYS